MTGNLSSALCKQKLTSEPVSVYVFLYLGARANKAVFKTAVEDLDSTNFDSVALDKTKDVLVEFYAPCKYILFTTTVNSFTSILVEKKSLNPSVTSELPITGRNYPYRSTSLLMPMTSSVLCRVKRSFKPYQNEYD